MENIWDKLTPKGQEMLLRRRERQQQEAWATAEVTKARVYHSDRVVHYDSGQTAYAVWLALDKGVQAAFRGAGDARPVYPHDLVDRL